MKLFYSIIICTLSMTLIANSQGWRKLYLPEIDSTARIIQFVDSLNGWVLAENQLFITTDGGDTWERNAYPTNYTLLNGKLIRNGVGFVLLSNKDPMYNYIQPIIYAFTYLGRTWKEIFQMKHPIIYLASTIVEDSCSFVLGRSSKDFNYYSWRLNNKQSNYDSTLLPYGYPFPVGNWAYSNIGFRDSLLGYITAYQLLAPGILPWGLVLKTTDGGKSWADDTVMYAAGFHEIEFTDSLRGYISAKTNYDYDPTFGRWTSSDAIRYTTDGGTSWMYTYHLTVGKGWFLNDTIFLCLSKEFFAWTKDGVLYRSILKGKNVRGEIVFDKAPLNDFSALNDRHIWLLAKDGKTIYKWDALLSTDALNTPLPSIATLSQNYPNPAHTFTSVNISLSNNSRVHINLYDLLGRKVRTLTDAEYETGFHTVQFNVSRLSAGAYLLQMTAVNEGEGFKTETRRLMIY